MLALAPDTLLVGNYNGGGMERSTDGGQTWAEVNGCSSGCTTGGPKRPGGFLVLPPGHAHAGRILAGGGPVFSDDRGATWAAATNSGLLNDIFAFALLPSGRVLAAFYGVFASDDGGATYTGPAPNSGVYNEGIAALATPGSVQSGNPSCGLADLSLCEGAVTIGFDTEADRAWWTNDGGRTWTGPTTLPQPYDGIGVGVM